MTKNLEDKIKQIPKNGWNCGSAAFIELGEILIDNGMSEDDAIEFLTCAYAAVAAEYED